MDIFKQQGVDPSYKLGKFHDFGYGVSLKLSSTRNPAYLAATQKYLEMHPELRAKFVAIGEYSRMVEYNRKASVKKEIPALVDPISDEESRALTLYSLVYGCIHDWKGVRVGEEEVPFSKEKALEILSDPRLEVFLSRITSFVNDLGNFEIEVDSNEVDSLKKNLSTT